ncbi:hypothetical protein ACFQI3_10210 [Hansschlegelia quercus]|uniref:Uncharacterized protein n=1 Tax=Hansschlegelia quercus TaxID=2528245 RepID=A0A4V2JEA0_9HYPH|nr:hypothetical protein [Hansschlegelia quercus]TBN54436.1 hypothetical protein EYR15_06285 [Hansschlegelia quercus]
MANASTTAFEPLIGVPCWRVERVQGSILSLQFGTPRLSVREPYVSTSSSAKVRQVAARRLVKPVGEWNLLVFCCHWRVVTSTGEVLAEDESPDEQIEASARVIDGQKLAAFALDAPSRQATFSFDLGATLSAWPYEANEEEQWSLYLPDGRVLTYRADGYLSLGAGDLKPEQEVWEAVAQDVCIPCRQTSG